jgi:hypothetical protein
MDIIAKIIVVIFGLFLLNEISKLIINKQR